MKYDHWTERVAGTKMATLRKPWQAGWLGLALLLALLGCHPRKTPALYTSASDAFQSWTKFSTELNNRPQILKLEEGAEFVLDLQSKKGGGIGMNKGIEALAGRVILEYRILESRPNAEHISLCVIPMRKPLPGQTALIEVGTKIDDPLANGFSKYRRVLPLPGGVQDGARWRKATLEFDFRNLADAASVVIAPRINEGFLHPEPGRLQIRRVVIEGK